MQLLETFDPAEYIQLPDGGYSPRRTKPCDECGESTWLIVKTSKLVDADVAGGPPKRVISTSLQCPNYYEHRRESPPRGLVVLGKFDVVAGEMVEGRED